MSEPQTQGQRAAFVSQEFCIMTGLAGGSVASLAMRMMHSERRMRGLFHGPGYWHHEGSLSIGWPLEHILA